MKTLPPRTPAQLLAVATRELSDATRARSQNQRYASAHLAALRAATAYVATRGLPVGADSRQARSVWDLLALAAPELAEQAAYFRDRASHSAAAQVGITRVVSEQEAAEHLHAAEQLVAIVEAALAAQNGQS